MKELPIDRGDSCCGFCDKFKATYNPGFEYHDNDWGIECLKDPSDRTSCARAALAEKRHYAWKQEGLKEKLHAN